jgi:hypothetical protein
MAIKKTTKMRKNEALSAENENKLNKIKKSLSSKVIFLLDMSELCVDCFVD